MDTAPIQPMGEQHEFVPTPSTKGDIEMVHIVKPGKVASELAKPVADSHIDVPSDSKAARVLSLSSPDVKKNITKIEEHINNSKAEQTLATLIAAIILETSGRKP